MRSQNRAALPILVASMEAWIHQLLALLALPEYGLSTLFLIAFVSATLLPMGSEPALFGLIKLNPELFWPAVLVATAGNTLGGAASWGMGYASHQLVDKYRHSNTHLRALDYLRDGGASTTLNCGYGHGFSVREVLRMVERVSGKALKVEESPRRAGDPPSLVAKADRIRAVLGWEPRLDDLETIVRTQLEWEYRLQREPGLQRN